MINVSNEYKQIISGDNREFYPVSEITLLDGTVLNLDKSRITSMKGEDAVSQIGQFTIGAAIINKLTLGINNMDDAYSDYDFTGAVIRPSVGLQLSETIETLPKGVFTADDPRNRSSVISLLALDNMTRFDKPFKDVVQSFPCEAGILLDTVCIHCGVMLATSVFPKSDYIIQNRPEDDAINCREVVSWIAQLGGNFARCNTAGSLEIKWYDFEAFESNLIDGGAFDNSTPYSTGDNVDGGDFTDYNTGDVADGGNFVDMDKYHNIYAINSLSTSTDDVVITGISVTDSSDTPNTVLFGESGYVISIEGNKLIQSQSEAEEIASFVGAKIVGMRFRPMETRVRSDFSREAGDIAYIHDRKGNTYQTLLSRVSWGVHQNDAISCDAEPPARNSSTRYSITTKAVVEARKTMDIKLTAYDLMVQQLNNLVAHSFGVYKTEEILPDGSVIYYMHDKPTIAESLKVWKQTADAFAVSTDGGATFTAGFDAEGNAVFNVLSAIGINVEWLKGKYLMSNDGATLIDLDYGVANEDNISESENIQSGFPLEMKFYIGDTVSKINKVMLQYVQKKFRTYSNGVSSGGGSIVSSSSGGSINTTLPYSATGTTYVNPTGTTINTTSSSNPTGSTNTMNPPAGTPHSHTFELPYHGHGAALPQHTHNFPLDHQHIIATGSHAHTVNIPDHTHPLNFGIMEQAISNYGLTVYVDGTLRRTIADNADNAQGIIDLTEYITTPGWHTIEIRSSTLKRISAQINIKSYIRS